MQVVTWALLTRLHAGLDSMPALDCLGEVDPHSARSSGCYGLCPNSFGFLGTRACIKLEAIVSQQENIGGARVIEGQANITPLFQIVQAVGAPVTGTFISVESFRQ